eukprot:GHVS01007537.1.p1 GENE.GHVS01007537.1~~GHVS01007537.1.p1  ORF type:complete len:410 (-),score=90.63 GHVS01007537.1:1155-2342(-)
MSAFLSTAGGDGRLSALELTACGVTSGVITKTLCAPFDRIRLLYQIQPMFSSSFSPSWKYSSIWNSVRTITAEEGLRGLWRGNTANIARAAVVYGVKFTTNDYVKQSIHIKQLTSTANGGSGAAAGELSVADLLCAGAAAGLVQKAGSYPLDLLSVRVALGINRSLLFNKQSHSTVSNNCIANHNTIGSNKPPPSTVASLTSTATRNLVSTARTPIPSSHHHHQACLSSSARPPPSSNSIFSVASSIYKLEGIAGYYKGFGPTLITGVPYVMLQMTFFDVLRRRFQQFASADRSSSSFGFIFLTSSLAGSIAGVAAQAVVFPGDTVRKRMMTNGLGGAPRLYRNSLDCFNKLLAREGARSFYSGLLPCVLRAIPSGAIQFGSYELCKALVVGYNR